MPSFLSGQEFNISHFFRVLKVLEGYRSQKNLISHNAKIKE